MKRTTAFLTAITVLFWTARVAAQTTAGKTPADPLPEWPQTFEEFLVWDVFDIAVSRILACLAILLVGLALKNSIIDRLLRPLRRALDRTETELDNAFLEAIRKPASWLVFVGCVWLAFEILQLPPGLGALVTVVLQTIGTVLVAWTLHRAIDVVGLALLKLTRQTEDLDDHLVPLVKRVLRVVLVCFAAVSIVQQWGYDVTSLVAGLGIGGIAFAMAAKDTVANWFGSLMIFTDQPFRLGDWIKTGRIEGVVEEIGLRSTKIRTFDRSLITVPNQGMANDEIENFTTRQARRINLTVGLEYGTSREQMLRILDEIRALLNDHPLTDPETTTVYFTGLGSSSLDLMVVVFFRTTAFAEFATARQEVLLEIMRIVEGAGSGFAFPSQSIYVETPIRTRAA